MTPLDRAVDLIAMTFLPDSVSGDELAQVGQATSRIMYQLAGEQDAAETIRALALLAALGIYELARATGTSREVLLQRMKRKAIGPPAPDLSAGKPAPPGCPR